MIVRVSRRPGKFVIDGGELARVWPGDRLDDELAGAIRGAFYIGPQRNLTQDVEFAIDTVGTLWLVQSRAITTLFPLPAGAPTDPRDLRRSDLPRKEFLRLPR